MRKFECTQEDIKVFLFMKRRESSFEFHVQVLER